MSSHELDLSRDYFDLFDLPKSFDIETDKLESGYRELQGIYHPDRYISAEARDRRLAAQASAWVNEGYLILRTPDRRARYLLELDGVRFDDERDTTSDPAFLAHQLELRESLEEAASAEDPLDALDQLNHALRKERDNLYGVFQERYESGNQSDAKRAVLELKYYARLLEEVDQRIDRLD